MPNHGIVRVISGGQWGADYGGLEAAEHLGIPTGGHAPKNYKTERGSNPELRKRFKLFETHSPGYSVRTRINVADADGTLIMATDRKSSGTLLTISCCEELERPYIVNPRLEEFRAWLLVHKIKVLNVAGNRESKSLGIQELTRRFLIESLSD